MPTPHSCPYNPATFVHLGSTLQALDPFSLYDILLHRGRYKNQFFEEKVLYSLCFQYTSPKGFSGFKPARGGLGEGYGNLRRFHSKRLGVASRPLHPHPDSGFFKILLRQTAEDIRKACRMFPLIPGPSQNPTQP